MTHHPSRLGRLAVLFAALLGLAAVSGPAFARPAPAPLIVVSLDGFRAEYFDRGLTPTLAELARGGVRAKAMRPSFPSVTEPNHYTLMTGLYPDHHGIVDNTMVDLAIPGLTFGGPHGEGADNDPRWWNQATPLWVTAERRGLKTASSWWPGDGAVIHGVAPSYLQPRPKTRELFPAMEPQIDTVLGWLDLPAAQRPALIRLHLDLVDLMGHISGPDGRNIDSALGKTDAALARLVAGLKSRGLLDKTNLVIVSDHGMTRVSVKTTLFLDDMIDLKQAVVTTVGATGGVNPAPGHEAEIAAVLLAPHDHLRCWRRADIPPALHYGHNPRVPAILCLADLGWMITTRADYGRYPPLGGDHGYDPAVPDMAALFIAHGPAFKTGVVLPAFDNVNVYALLTRVLRVPAEPNDGSLAPLRPALAGGT